MMRSMRADKNANSMLQRIMPNVVKQAIDLNLAVQGFDKGYQLIKLNIQASVCAPHAELETATGALKSVFKKNNFSIRTAEGVQLASFMAALPGGCEEVLMQAMDRFGRSKTVLSHNAVSFLPLYGEWRGNASAPTPPLLLLAGRRGELVGWTPFKSDGNYNVAVVGKSGAGKSVVMQDILAGMVATGGAAVVIDDGYSFANSCRFLSGAHIDFAESHIELNPFAMLDTTAMAASRIAGRATTCKLQKAKRSLCGWQCGAQDRWLSGQTDLLVVSQLVGLQATGCGKKLLRCAQVDTGVQPDKQCM